MNTYDYYKAELKDLDSLPSYERGDRQAAIAMLMEHNELVSGIVYQQQDSAPFEDRLPGFRAEGLATQSLELNEREFDKLVAGYR